MSKGSSHEPKGFIYFVQGKLGTPIKIGFTLRDLQQRLKGLQTSSPEELRPLVLVSGDTTEERALHQYFSKYHIRGEWFEAAHEILNVIEKLESDGRQELERLIDSFKVRALKEAGYSEKDKKHRSPKVRLMSYEALGGWERALKDRSREIRLRAYERTNKWEDALQDKSVVVRREAYERTNRWEDALNDPDPQIRFEAYDRLDRLDEAYDDPIIKRDMEETDRQVEQLELSEPWSDSPRKAEK